MRIFAWMPIVLVMLFFPVISLSQGIAVGTRIDLTESLNLNEGTSGQFAQLFIPDYYQFPADGQFTLVFHLHSASWAAEDEVYKAHANAILFNIHLGGLSSPYQNYFTDSAAYPTIRATILSTLTNGGYATNPVIARTLITSFSAGYAGVREILKTPANWDNISSINLADGLHCSSNSATMAVQMQDFLSFAEQARDMEKVMLLTHSSITTSGYQSTTQTADYLINGIGALRVPFLATDEIGTQYSRCDTGKFHIKGYYGQTAADHLQHLYNMDLMLGQAFAILDSTALYLPEIRQGSNLNFRQRNYPNPFNPVTRFSYSVSPPAQVHFGIYDITGKLMETLVAGETQSGVQTVTWDASCWSSGVYLYLIDYGLTRLTGKCVLAK